VYSRPPGGAETGHRISAARTASTGHPEPQTAALHRNAKRRALAHSDIGIFKIASRLVGKPNKRPVVTVLALYAGRSLHSASLSR